MSETQRLQAELNLLKESKLIVSLLNSAQKLDDRYDHDLPSSYDYDDNYRETRFQPRLPTVGESVCDTIGGICSVILMFSSLIILFSLLLTEKL